MYTHQLLSGYNWNFISLVVVEHHIDIPLTVLANNGRIQNGNVLSVDETAHLLQAVTGGKHDKSLVLTCRLEMVRLRNSSPGSLVSLLPFKRTTRILCSPAKTCG